MVITLTSPSEWKFKADGVEIKCETITITDVKKFQAKIKFLEENQIPYKATAKI